MEYDPKYLTPEQLGLALARTGFQLDGKGRPDTTGKTQVRVKSEDDCVSVSVSVVPKRAVAGWENAHSHHGQDELYVVLKGMIILALHHKESGVKYVVLTAGESRTVPKGVEHNVFTHVATVTVVSKLGEPVPYPHNEKGNDWWPAPLLDNATKAMSSVNAERMSLGLGMKDPW